MVEQREHIDPDRVIGEIDSTLTEARQNLEQYADSAGDSVFLDNCRIKIQQIHRTLKRLKQQGTQFLTREMLLLLDSLKTTPIENSRQQQKVLIRAMNQLPGYLAYSLVSGKDTPDLLNRLLSDMRQLREQQALSDIDNVMPGHSSPGSVDTLAPIPQAQLEKLQNSGFAVLVRKIRQKYQLCLAGVLRDRQREQQLAIISKLFARLQNLCWNSPISPLWDACTAFSEGLKEGSIAIDSHAITLLREMDHELKYLANEEAWRLNTPPPEALLREMLYRIGNANSDNALILSLKRRYSLDMPRENLDKTESAPKPFSEKKTAKAEIEPEAPIISIASEPDITVNAFSNPLLSDRDLDYSLAIDFSLNTEDLPALEGLAIINESTSTDSTTLSPTKAATTNSTDATLPVDNAADDTVLLDSTAIDTSLSSLEETLPVSSEDEYDDNLHDIYVAETTDVQQQLAAQIPGWRNNIHDASRINEIRSAFHTLKNSGRMIGADIIGELAWSVENMLNSVIEGTISASEPMAGLLDEIITMLPELLDDFVKDSQQLTPEVLLCMEKADALGKGSNFTVDFDEEEEPDQQEPAMMFGTILEESEYQQQQAAHSLTSNLDLLPDASSYRSAWVNSIPPEELDQFRFDLKVLAHHADGAGLSAMAELCDVLLDVCVYLETYETRLPQPLLSPFTNGFKALGTMMDQLAAQQTPDSPLAVFSALREALESLLLEQSFQNDNAVQTDPDKPALASPTHETESDRKRHQLFIEEAFELLEDSARSLETWLRAPDQLQPVHSLQRYLHTLEGGAIMAELSELGDLSHALEAIYKSITNGSCAPENAPLALIQKTHDTIEAILRAHGKRVSPPDAQRMLEELRQWQARLNTGGSATTDIDVLPDYLGQTFVSEPITHDVSDDEWLSDLPGQPVEPTPDPVSTTATEMTADAENTVLQSSSDEMIRISPELMETLITLAGEACISRSRMEQQTADANRMLAEMGRTIVRLQEPLRCLETEETQDRITPRHQENPVTDPDGAPLEMEPSPEPPRYARSMIESVSDLMSLCEALQKQTRDSQTLLRQQSRDQIELQEQLMKARMVPFSHRVPRLHQFVHQISDELNKPVKLLVSNAGVEMDSVMLEQLLTPLEHILRYSIDHGIEDTPEERRASGKPESGQISLSTRQDGADIIIELSDDGRGINIEAVKARAIELKLISPDEPVAGQDAIKLIMTPGFSTAPHMARQGVGLDIVDNSIRQLGGTVQVTSETGQGLHFTLRLPSIQPITRALIVEAGSSLYALPMQAIDGVTMVSSSTLTDCYRNNTPLIYGNGTEHRLVYMGALTGTASPIMGDEACPVVLVQRGSENIAVQVDAMEGSREIITKSLGVQFSGLAGVNGATILDDGRIAVILDPAALYRKHQLSMETTKPATVESVESDNSHQTARVLVVDDSVTVRKVTGQLLSRQGYGIISAQDGIEAMTRLSELKPDLMLLDIEMPRMDGFAVISAVRNDPQLQDLPIIMMTSRTGEKHRQRAFSLGANEYIGKPFQEGPLLEAIEKLIAVEIA